MPTDWEIMKQSADSPEERKEFDEIEKNSELNDLENMKRYQVRIGKDGYVNPDGSKATYKNFTEINIPLRKKAEKIFKNKAAVNKFMLAKQWTNTSRDKDRPYESILDRLQEDK
tara:strand:+ start:1325 stop:1666 length:342 start_codon:yes stop_codon:yes gene_type:complete